MYHNNQITTSNRSRNIVYATSARLFVAYVHDAAFQRHEYAVTLYLAREQSERRSVFETLVNFTADHKSNNRNDRQKIG